jgi:hypothetical protein
MTPTITSQHLAARSRPSNDPPSTDRPSTGGASDRPTESGGPAALCLLLAALSLALLAQGAYYAPVQWGVGIATAGAAAVTMATGNRRGLVSAPVVGCLLLAGWSLVRGLAGSSPTSGLRPALLALGLATAFTVARRLTVEDRELATRVLMLLGAVVALAGWAGVVWHLSPYALANDGVWRAASTLTYANASAAVLGCLTLALAGLASGRPHDPRRAALLALLMVGTGATLSRAGFVALVVGTLVLLVLRGPGPVLRASVGPALGALVALLGLVPSMPLSSAGGRPVAVVALVAGLVLAASLPTPRLSSLGRVALVVAAAATVVVLTVGPQVLVGSIDDVAGWRAHASSPARVEAARAGLALAAERPWTGAGPGDGWTSWRGEDGSRATMRYVHDEYLQLAVDLGLPGLLLALMVLITAGRGLVSALRLEGEQTAKGLTAGACAALAAAAVHAGFDFVWHVPAVPLLVAVVVGLGCRGTRPATAGEEQKGVVA